MTRAELTRLIRATVPPGFVPRVECAPDGTITVTPIPLSNVDPDAADPVLQALNAARP